MRIKDALVPTVIHAGLNNNQVELGVASVSSSSAIENRNDTVDKNYHEQSKGYEIQGFRRAEDTTTWSSVAVARTNVNNVQSKRVNNNNINNNLSISRLSLSSSTESLSDYEAHELSAESEYSENSDEGILPTPCRGIINPNYPGFQHLAPSFLSVFAEEDQPDSSSSSPRIDDPELENKINEQRNNNKEVEIDDVNRLDGRKSEHNFFYEKSNLNIQTVTSYYEDVVSSSEKCLNYVKSVEESNVGETPVVEDNHHHWDNISVEIEVAELQSTSIERPQFPEIEEITSETEKPSEADSEPEELLIERIDLIPDITIVADNTINHNTNKVDNNSKHSESSTDSSEGVPEEQHPYTKLEEIDLLSSIGRDIGVDLEKYIQPVPDVVAMETVDVHSGNALPGLVKDTIREDTNKLMDQELAESTSADSRKKEKMARNQARRRQQSHTGHHQRRPDKRRAEHGDKAPGGFDVYNIETAMPKIDLDAIESHLRAAREEERRLDEDPVGLAQRNERLAEVVEAVATGRELASSHRDKEDVISCFDRIVRGEFSDSQRRNDREEIRRRLAMGPDADDLRAERGRKPSLQSRLQSGMNLQICFMNETPSDTESLGSESDVSPGVKQTSHHSQHSAAARPQILSLPPLRLETDISSAPLDEADFFARQARLQTEARMALAQAKEMAHMQMEVERQRLKQSPITEMVRSSLEKVGVQLGEDRRRLSRVLLTELNVAQLQVVANDLHARIAVLNEALVEGLLRRDDLHMEQDSMLVDVEDLTRYLGAKQESMKKRQVNVKEQAAAAKNNRVSHQQQQQQPQHRQQASHSTMMMMMMMPSIRTKLANRGIPGFVRK